MSWYLSLSRGKQIALAVLIGHGFLLVLFGADHWMHRATIQRKKVTVNTVVIATPPKIETTVQKTKAAAPSKKTIAKPIAKKQPIASSKKAEETLLREIEESLEAVTKNAPSLKKSAIVVPTLNLQLQQQTEEDSGTEQIAALLQEALELPERGEVKIKLSISKFGRLENLEILEAKSQKNAEFLKKRLPELSFPCLNEVTTLTIVFSNAL